MAGDSGEGSHAEVVDAVRKRFVIDAGEQARLVPPPRAPADSQTDQPTVDTPGEIVDHVVNQLQTLGLPVQMLRDVRRSGYEISGGASEDHVSPWFNKLSLRDETWEQLRTFDLGSDIFVIGSVGTLYHEATHAWMDLNSRRADVTALRELSRIYYSDSPLVDFRDKQVGYADDPNRIFEEAAAAYVDHRMEVWLRTFKVLEILARDPEVRTEFIADQLAKIQADYDSQMADHVFGYEMEGGILGFGGMQAATTLPIRDDLRQFLNIELLERRIVDNFEDDEVFRTLRSEAARRIPVEQPQ
jgi:hypothetical protein